MKLLKPSWINHDGHPIFSIDIHPDDTRFATGGQGTDSVGRVVIWNMLPLLEEKEDTSKIPKMLCQLDHHNACVNSVRWSHSGKYLASGGDDKIIIIWKMTAKLGSVSSGISASGFGKPAYETWKPMSTLSCHTGDVLHLAWSPNDNFLASASVDNTVIIWNARSFPQVVAHLKDHSSLVKGVTWDPVGKYIATQSDDKTLKIWRTSDWTVEHSVSDSFTECGGTTHVLRLDWSPDGVYLVSAHAMNGGGPTAQIVERDGWKTDKDFVGHRKAVVCVRFTRTMLQQGKSQMCCVALGSRDRSISVWSTALKRPVVVVRDAFTSSILDLCWSTSATVMMACSWDGTAAVAYFTENEIGKPLSSEEMTNLHLKVYGKNVSSSTCNLVQNLEVFLARKRVEQECVGNSCTNIIPPSESPEKHIPGNNETVIRGPTDRQIETRTADGKRRITPKFLLPPDRTLAQNPSSHISEDMVFREITEVSNLANQTSLRDNMVSGIEDIKLASEAKLNNMEAKDHGPDSEVEPQIQNNDKDLASNSALSANDKSSSLSSSSSKLQSAEIEIHKENNISIERPLMESTQTLHEAVTYDSLRVKSACDGENDGESVEVLASSIPNNSVTVTDEKSPAIMIGVKRKRTKSDEMKPPNAPRKKKLQQTSSSGVAEKLSSDTSSPAGNYSQSNGIDFSQHRASSTGPGSQLQLPQKSNAQARRLLPMKIDGVFSCKVNNNRGVNYILEVENSQRRASASILRCKHDLSSLHGLDWSISTESPVCGVVGDMHRIISTCEDFTVHVLDLKGRYAFPPILLPSHPSRLSQNGSYFMVITVKATIHVWNIHTKKILIKSESLLPLLNQPGHDTGHSVDVSYASVMANGVPMLILSNEKTFMFSLDMQAWMMMSDPSVPAKLNLRGEEVMHQDIMFSTDKKRLGNKQHSLITSVKLKLASATELRKTADVRKWILVLAKSLANYDLRKELHQLCEDLLGPTHSSAQSSNSWAPTVVGVDKRDLLKEILAVLLTDLRWQDFYCEFTDLLALAEHFQSTLFPDTESLNGVCQ